LSYGPVPDPYRGQPLPRPSTTWRMTTRTSPLPSLGCGDSSGRATLTAYAVVLSLTRSRRSQALDRTQPGLPNAISAAPFLDLVMAIYPASMAPIICLGKVG
jgi:hypothetical protein